MYRDFRIKSEELNKAIQKKLHPKPKVIESQNSSDAFEAIEDESSDEGSDVESEGQSDKASV